MGIATQRFSDTKQTQLIDGSWKATIGWDVIDYISDYDAVNSCPIKQGSQHPLNEYLTCTSIGVTENKLTKAIVIAEFEVTSLIDAGVNPINRPEVINWKWGKQTLPVDTDASGNPIVNSAGDAFRSNYSRNFSVRYLRVTRWELYYDQALASSYIDTTNSDTVTIQHTLSVGPGQMYFVNYAPVEEYQINSPYVKAMYEFEIRTPSSPNLTTLQARYPFQLRLVDQGQRGKYLDPNSTPTTNAPTMGNFWLGGQASQECRREVLLNGQGRPADATVKLTQNLYSVQSNTIPTSVQKETINGVTFLVYLIYAEQPFLPIGL